MNIGNAICPILSNRTVAMPSILPHMSSFWHCVKNPFSNCEMVSGISLEPHLWSTLPFECSDNGILDTAEKTQCFIEKLTSPGGSLAAICESKEESVHCPIKDRMEGMLAESETWINDRLLEHILGGHFGRQSGLEGYSQAGMIAYIAESISHRLTLLKNSLPNTNSSCAQMACEKELGTLEELSLQFTKAKEIGELLREENFQAFAERICQELQELAEGKSFFFQGGWTGRPGHAMIYEVAKEQPEHFTLRFYNRGAGLQYHESFHLQGKDFFLPFLEIVEIPFKNLSSDIVLKAFYDLQQMPEIGRDWQERDLYTPIILALGGKISSRQYTDEQYLEKLSVGNCSYLSLSAWMSQAVQSSHLYRQWEFDLQFKTLWSYYLQHQEPLSQSSLMLVEKSIEQLARNAKESFANRMLSLEEWSFVNARLQEVKNFFKAHAFTSRAAEALEKRLPFSPQEWLSANWTVQNISESLFAPIPLARGELFTSLQFGDFAFQPQTWIVDLSTIRQDIQNAIERLYEPEALTVFRIKSGLESLAKALPLREIQKLREKGELSASQAKETVSLIAELAKDYLWTSINVSFLQKDRQSLTSLEGYVTAVKFLTVADALCMQFSSNECLHLPNLFQRGMDFEDVGPVANLKLIEEIESIRSYWETRESGKPSNGHSFFGYENIPAALPLSATPIARSVSFSDLKSPWQDLNWAKDQVASREVRKKIKEKYPDLAQEHSWVQAAACMSGAFGKIGELVNEEREISGIFPQTFFDFRDLSFIVDYILRNDATSEIRGFQRSKKFASLTVSSNESATIRVTPLSAFSSSNPNEVTSISRAAEEEEIPLALDYRHRLKGGYNELPQAFSPFYQKGLEREITHSNNTKTQEYAVGSRSRVEPHHCLAKGPIGEFHLEETRALYGLSSLPAHQVIDTFFYFRDRMHLLAKEPGYRALFKYLMFEHPLLRDVFRGENGPIFAKELSSFCTSYFHTYREIGDIPMALYVLELSRLSTQIAKLAGNVVLDVPDVKKEVEDLLLRKDLSTRDEALLRIEQLHHFSVDSLDKDEVAKCVSSAIWVGRFGQDPQDPFTSKIKELEVRDLMTQMQGKILGELAKNTNEILNAIASNLLKRPIETIWIRHGLEAGVYLDAKYLIHIDPIGARLYEKETDAIQAPLPFSIKNADPGVLKTFGQQEIFAKEVDFGEFLLENARGEEFRFKQYNEGLSIQRKIGSEWYSLISEPLSNFPTPWKRHHFWKAHRIFKDHEQESIWVSDPENGKFIAEIVGKKAGLDFDLEKSEYITTIFAFKPEIIYQLDEERKRTGLKLGAASKKTLKYLAGFEDPNYVLPWININKKNPHGRGSLSQIDLPRFGLTFQMGESKRILCKELKPYSIAETQHLPSLGGMTNYLVLERDKIDEPKKKEKLVLFPKLPLKKVQMSFKPQTEPEAGKRDEISYVSFRVDDNGNLSPIGDRGDEARLFLAMMVLWEHRYDEALGYLLEQGSQIRRFSQGEIEILKWIVQLGEKNQDHSPKALAVRLKAGTEILKNRLDFRRDDQEENDSSFLQTLTDLYHQVIEKADQIPKRFAPTQEEMRLLLNLPKSENPPPADIQQVFPLQDVSKTLVELFFAIKEELGQPEKSKNLSLLYADGLTSAFIRNLYRWARHPSVASYEKLYAALTNQKPLSSLTLTELYRFFYEKKGREAKIYPSERELQLETIYREVMGSSMPLKPSKAENEKKVRLALLKTEILSALRMVWTSQSKAQDRLAAAILGRVLNEPEAFRTQKDVLEIFSQSNDLDEWDIVRFFSAFSPSKIFDEKGIHHFEGIGRAQDRGTCFLGMPNEQEKCTWGESLGKAISWNPSIPDMGKVAIPPPISGDIPKISQKLVLKEPLTAAFREKREQGFTELSALFSPGEGRDRASKWYLEKLMQRLKECAELSAKDAGNFALSGENAAEFVSYLNQVIYAIDSQGKTLQQRSVDNLLEIQKLLQKHTEAENEQSQKSGLLSGDDGSPSLGDLLYFFALGDSSTLQEMNPSLNREDIARIFGLIQEVLLDETGLQYLKRLHTGLENTSRDIFNSIFVNQINVRHGKKFEANYKAKQQEIQQRNWFSRWWTPDEKALQEYLVSQNRSPDFDPQENIRMNERNLARFLRELDTLFSLENSKRSYRVEEHPEYLVFEYFNDILLRPNQVENLEKLGTPAATILEMIMAGGKTAVLIPLIALKRADGKTIPVVVMPDELIAETAKTLRQRLKKSFDRRIEILEVKREEIDLQQLKRMEHRLKQAQIDKKAVLMGGSSLQTLFLGAIERFVQLADPKNQKVVRENYVEELDAIRGIIELLRSDGNLILDEVDLMFDVLRTHQFTIGGSQSMDEKLLDAVTEFYRLSIEKFPSISWAFLSSPRERIFSHNGDDKKRFIDAVIDKENIPVKRHQKVYDFFDEKEGLEEFMNELSTRTRDFLAVCKEELNTVFPLTERKRVDEHYGALPVGQHGFGSSPYMAIPYHGCNSPVIGSEFGSDLEIINYTIQLHLSHPIPQQVIESKIQAIQIAIQSGLKKNVPLEKLDAFQDFLSLGAKADTLSNPQKASEQIQQSLEKNLGKKLSFIRQEILPGLKTYQRQIRTDGHIYPHLAKQILGFSGTLWNADTYPKIFQNIYFSDTEPSTLIRLWEDCGVKEDGAKQGVSTFNGSIEKEGIAKIFSPFYHIGKNADLSVIDLGGVFRGMDNRQVARELLALCSNKISGVIFFERDHAMVLKRGKDIPIDLAGVSKEERGQLIAFWDQKHTTGADLQGLDSKMKAMVTVSRYTMMRDLMQASWRLRGLDKSQRVFFALPQEEKEVMLQKLELDPKREQELSLAELFQYVKEVETSRQSNDNFRALQRKLMDFIAAPLLDLFFHSQLSWEWKKQHLYPSMNELFVFDKTPDLFRLYGMPNQEIGAEEAMQRDAHRLHDIVDRFSGELNKQLDAQGNTSFKIKQAIAEMSKSDLGNLPEKVRKHVAYETEVEIEQELEVNQEVKKQTAVAIRPREIVTWPFRKLSDHYFRPISREDWYTADLDSIEPLEFLDAKELARISEKLSPKILKKSEGDVPLIRVNDVLDRSHFRQCVDHSLLSTMNLMPVYPAIDPVSFELFGQMQDLSKRALILKDKQERDPTKGLLYVMLSPWDAFQWETFLQSADAKENIKNSAWEIGLFHSDLGFYRGADDAQWDREWKSQFRKLNVQAKFLSGKLDYSDEEIRTLNDWVKEQKIDEQFFTQGVLKIKSKSLENYPGSDVWKVLHNKE